MPITVQWYDPIPTETVLLMTFTNTWTWDDLRQAQQETITMIDSVEEIVPVIVDMRESARLPLGVLRHAPQLLRQTHPRRGRLFILGSSHLLRPLWQTVLQIANPILPNHKQVTYADTWDEIHAQLPTRNGMT